MAIKKLLYTLILSSISTIVLAQNVIEVKVVDENSDALSYINVVIRNKADSTIITGGITNELGLFSIKEEEISPIENKIITVKAIGFSPYTISDLSAKNFLVVLKESSETLGEVVITAKRRPLTSITSEGISISLENSPLSHIGTGMDLLAQLPLLSGDTESVSVLGRGVPLIYINGRKANSIQDVKQLKSSDIKSVKVITNPGAQYDASVSSVLLISTYKPLDTGFGGTLYGKVSVGHKVSSDQYLFLQYRRGTLDVFGSIYNIQSDSPSNQSYSIMFPSLVDKSTLGNADMRIQRLTQHYTLGINYLPSQNHSIGLKYVFSNKSRGDIHIESSTISQSATTSTKDEYIKDKTDEGKTHSLNLYWLGQLTDNYSIKLDTDIYNTQSNSNEEVSQQGVAKNIITTYDVNTRLYAARLVNMIGLWGGELSVGGEISKTDNQQSFSSSTSLIDGGNNHLKNIAAAGFLTYSKSFNRFSSQIGLRYEFNDFEYIKNGEIQKEQSKQYHNLFPHISAVYQGWLNAQFSYRSTISRPSYHQLRSSVQYNTSEMFESGNPYLKPMISHLFSLDLQKDGLMVGTSFSKINNLIYADISQYRGEPIVLFQHKNLDQANVLQLYATYQKKVGWWTPNIYLGYDKPYVKVGNNEYNQGRFIVTQKNTFTFPYNIFLWANYSFQSEGNSDTALFEPVHMFSLRMMKRFLENKLSVSIDISDLFNSSKQAYLLKMNSIEMYSHTKFDSRKISLTITYDFNSKKTRYQGTQSTDEIGRL